MSTAGRTWLVIVPPAAGASGVGPDTVVAGLPLARRIRLAARRAGWHVVAGDDAAGPNGADGRVVVVPTNVVPQAAWLAGLAGMPLVPGRVYVDASGVAMVHAPDAGATVRAVADAASADDAVRVLGERFPVVAAALDPGGRFPLSAGADVAAAERWLLRSLVKPSEGFMSRHVERRISLAITRRLVRTRVTPNAMTLVSLAIGLLGAPFFLSPAPALQLTGALLFLTHSILDGCDGELARLKFLESRGGAALDFWGDNLVHAAVFGCIAIGWALDADSLWPLVPGILAVGATALAAATLAPAFLRPGSGRCRTTGAARVAEALSHRDFIYLVVVLGAFGKAAWFLVLAAAGTPVFLVFLWLMGRGRNAR